MQFPHLRKPLIEGLLREGETMNVIAPPKTGKSWLVTDLAIAVATGRPWLDTFQTHRGSVLIIDNELHGETSAHRIPKVAEARGVPLEEIDQMVYVENLRGRLRDLMEMSAYFKAIGPRQFKLIVLDAFYRFIPRDTDENDNGSVARLYNLLDHFALELQCSFVLIHHSTKGNQSAKAITDVGAGAGSQSRATDTHLILRAHEEPEAVVLDAAVRSWPKVTPLCLKWSFPVWNPAFDLDPEALKPERPSRRRAKQEDEPAKPAEPPWDSARFVREFIKPEARTRAAIIEDAVRAGLSERRAERLLQRAEDMALAHRWKFDSNAPVKYATVSQPLLDVGPAPKPARKKRKRKESLRARARTPHTPRSAGTHSGAGYCAGARGHGRKAGSTEGKGWPAAGPWPAVGGWPVMKFSAKGSTRAWKRRNRSKEPAGRNRWRRPDAPAGGIRLA